MRLTNYIFRITFLLGLLFLFFSVFLEWYCFQIFDLNNNLIVSWNYRIFLGWVSPFSGTFTLNEVMKPESSGIPLIINFIFLCLIIVSAYVALFKDINQAVKVKYYSKYAYINGFVLLITAFYVIIAPLIYLAPYELYFPLLNIRNYNAGFIFLYAIGPGYVLQFISFPLMFPYSIFYYRTITIFQQEEHSPEKILDNIINHAQELLDLDKLIAEEELKQEFDTQPHEDDINNSNSIYRGE
ncbi:MAG: hypothetical protein ACFE75_02945 [Candidatus Hodarchaeota archaeon]